MKDFIKSVAATVVGIVAFLAIAGIFAVMSIIGMVASTEATRNVSDNSVLVLNLSGNVEEQGGDNIIGKLTDNTINPTSKASTLKQEPLKQAMPPYRRFAQHFLTSRSRRNGS